ncbi:MAG: D-glycerate dehydrogenase [Pseudomonadota bacterium]|nr:D-glycerate dehydrogenase [Pseudomonadota bacterium]
MSRTSEKPTIFVTRRWPDAAEKALEEFFAPTFNEDDVPLTETQIAEGFAGHDALAPTVSDQITAEIIAAGAAGSGQLIANFGVGVNHIDLPAAAAAGLAVSNTPGVLTDATADLALTLMLMVSRRAGEGERELRAGEWHGWRPTHLMGRSLCGKTLGIIGMGRIGKAVAYRAALGFGMKIIFFNRSRVTDITDYDAKQIDDLEVLCAQSDFLSLHCAASADTFHILNEERLKCMQAHAYVINTARGDVIDEAALVRALQSGSIGGAGLDVFQGEPEIHRDILAAPNTVLLPHLGSATVETRTAMGLKVVENARAFFAGERLVNPVV